MPPSGSRSGAASVSGHGSRSSSLAARKVGPREASALASASGLGDKLDEGVKLKTRSAVPSSASALGAKTSTTGLSSTSPRTARARKSTLHGPSALKSASSLLSSTTAQNHGISLSPSSHPRTDPLSALSTLLKLLRSLPGRVGGCAYKLTPAEHALTIHLVGVLDPYVFRGYRASTLASTSSLEGVDSSALPLLLQQPTEILDAVLSHLDARKDVLSLGLTCKRLWEVVSPRHLEYRVVKAKPSNVAVWAHLVRNRDLARNVRRLEVLDERMAFGASASLGPVPPNALMRVPRTLVLSRDTDHDSTDDELALHVKYQKYLCAALGRMTTLKHLRWGTGKAGPGGVRLSDIWPVLMKNNGGVLCGLRELVVVDNFLFQPLLSDQEEGTSESEDDSSDEEGAATAGTVALAKRSSNAQLAHCQPTNLPEMQTIIFRSTAQAYGAAKQPELGRINAVLNQCVNLKSLEIVYIPPRSMPSPGTAAAGVVQHNRPLANDLLLYCRLSQLTHLTLTNLLCTSSEAVSGFLAAHHVLEVLHLQVSIHGMLELPKGTLPRLREVKASKEVVNAILECPLDSDVANHGKNRLRPLEVIKGFKLSGLGSQGQSTRNIPDSRFLSNLRLQGSTISRVVMTGYHDMEDVKRIVGCVPGLAWLDVGRKLGASGPGAAAGQKGPVTNLTEWTEVLSTLPELVAVHGVRFFYEVSTAAMGYDDSDRSTYSTPQPGVATSAATANPSWSINNGTSQHNLSMMERSRMRKNDEIAGVLAWKCRKLRRLDHWESYETGTAPSKVVVLLRDGKEVRWEVRRVRA